jgi:NADH-quinone oxidoreductase subunit M
MNHLLSWIVFLPMLGSIALLLTPSTQDKAIRWIGMLSTVLTFVLSLIMLSAFEVGAVGYQFVEKMQLDSYLRH